MAIFFTMPKLGMNMTEGHIVGWLAKEGSKVKKGEPILEIETDKATNEVEAPASGILAKIMHAVGEDVPCNSVLAVILQEGEDLPEKIPAMIGEDIAPKSEFSNRLGVESAPQNTNKSEDRGKRIRVSPSAKKLAQDLGVDLSTIIPKGSQIKREDVQRAYDAEQKSSHVDRPTGATSKPYRGMRKLIGNAMATSSSVTARVSLFLEANAAGLLKKRKEFESKIGKVSYNVLLAKLVAEALTEFAYMNAQLADDRIWEYSLINVGIAMDSSKGLLVPVLKDVDKKSVEELNEEFRSLSERALNGKATTDDLSDGTFTITNLGAHEIESFVPIINHPECAILGVGAILEKAVVANGNIEIQPMVGLTLVFDHRLVDGAPAAKFLQKIKALIENLEYKEIL